jgi:predicted RNase H-like nuclease
MGADHAVLGIDGCPGGWVGALVTGSIVTWYAGTLASLLSLGADVTAIDIPLALPADGRRRACEVAARERLGAQRSSIFFTPPAGVLTAGSHTEASALSRAAGSVGVSVQTWNIIPKMAEALGHADALVEVHPELSFRAMGPVTASKKTEAGRDERLALLHQWLPAVPVERPGRAAIDDSLDALACAWTALRVARGEAFALGREDLGGRVSQIVV